MSRSMAHLRPKSLPFFTSACANLNTNPTEHSSENGAPLPSARALGFTRHRAGGRGDET